MVVGQTNISLRRTIFTPQSCRHFNKCEPNFRSLSSSLPRSIEHAIDRNGYQSRLAACNFNYRCQLSFESRPYCFDVNCAERLPQMRADILLSVGKAELAVGLVDRNGHGVGEVQAPAAGNHRDTNRPCDIRVAYRFICQPDGLGAKQ